MATGFFSAAFLCLVLGQTPGDALHFNYRNHRIPVEVPVGLRADIKELLLYGSADQGRTWNLVAGPITPEKDHFAFFAPGDGAYWLRVVQINKNGVQEPDIQGIKNGPPNMKLMIDTLKPIVKSLQAQRVEDEIYVSWEVQEDQLDAAGMQLEYMIKDAPGGLWRAVPIQAGLRGQTRFNPGTRQALSVRLTVRDLAKNESFGMADVAGMVSPAGFSPSTSVTPMPTETYVAPKENVQVRPMGEVLKTLPPPPTGIDNPLDRKPASLVVPPPPMGIENPLDRKPVNAIAPPPMKESPAEKVVADSSLPPPVAPRPVVAGSSPTSGGIRNTSADTVLDTKPINTTAVTRKLPALQYVNQHHILLEYELKRVGPSGIGGIEVWLTKDDGETWEPYRKDEDVQSGAVNLRQKRNIDLRDPLDRPLPDGIYGMALVVKSRAGLGRQPRPGDLPEIRVEIDTQRPAAKLFMPVPDPQHPDQLLLKWSASDKNLADRPIHLEFSTKIDGDWQPIKLDLENTGRYTNENVTGDFSWKVPAGTPLQVYLRMRVRDKAGNELVLVTPQPQFVDLTEPEGALIGVQPNSKAP